MMDIADVSVVMPTYNNADTIGRALASIAGQTLPPREVIVVDDGSTDGTADVVAAMAKTMGPVKLRLFRQSNNGAGAARNRALAVASATWLAFLDADDEWVANKLERSMAMTDASRHDMTAHNVVILDGDTARSVDCHARWAVDPSDPFRALFKRGFISSSTVLLRRAVALRVGGFDAGLRSAQDYELWLAVLAEIGDRFLVFDEVLLRYYWAPNGITSHIDRKILCSLAILQRHLANLKRRPGPVLQPVLFRLAAIFLEAVRAHLARGAKAAALRTVLGLPGAMLRALAALPAASYQRPDFLAALPPAEEIALLPQVAL